MTRRALSTALLLLFSTAAAAQAPWTKIEYPQDKDKTWWWDTDWWERGQLPAMTSHDVTSRQVAYKNGDTEVPVAIYRPKQEGRFPVILFQHGRRGVDELTRLIPLRLAARGFVVVAPDLYSGRFIEKYPVSHDPVLEDDMALGIDFALSLPEAKNQPRLCVVSHTRGGYYTLQALTAKKRQDKTACYVSYYPVWQDPNAPEAAQVYQYAPGLNELAVPVLVFIGEHEQYHRARQISAGIDTLQKKGRNARLLVYPGVGRGFDFRPPEVRTLADDMATQDSLRRLTVFIHQHLRLPSADGAPASSRPVQ
jgi:carboxymethylenebutenolidase